MGAAGAAGGGVGEVLPPLLTFLNKFKVFNSAIEDFV